MKRKEMSLFGILAIVPFLGMALFSGCASTSGDTATASQADARQTAVFSYDTAAFPGAKPWTSKSFKNDPESFQFAIVGDRTGWSAAALLTLLGVPKDQVYEDYLRSNDNILPAYKHAIDPFVEAGGDPEIPAAILGVKREYLDAAFDEMETTYGTIENYFAEGLGIEADQQQVIREIYLGER